MNVIEALAFHESRRTAIRENSARAATQYATFTSDGAGTHLHPEPVRFATPFVGEPAIATGFALTRPPDADIWELPRVTAGVYRWIIEDDHGFHTGAYVYFAVDCPYTEAGQELVDAGELGFRPEPVLVHHFAFTGLSYKDLPGTETLDDRITPHALPGVF